LHAPKLNEEAQTEFLQGFSYTFEKMKFHVETEWVHGKDLVAQFPRKVQPHLKDKLGE
jgi:hypothetical protein